MSSARERGPALHQVALVVVDLLDEEEPTRRLPGQRGPTGSAGHPRRPRRTACGRPRTSRNDSSIAAASSPSGAPPPSGDMFFQSSEWSTCPDTWNARFFWRVIDGAEFTRFAGFIQLLERGVRAGNVRGVVLVVVELHDSGREMGFEGGDVIVEFGQRVVSGRSRGMAVLLVAGSCQARAGMRHSRHTCRDATWGASVPSVPPVFADHSKVAGSVP